MKRARTPLPPADAAAQSAFTVRFDDRALRALPGQSIAAVLLAGGVRSWRVTRRRARPRGVFCGIGQCFDCLVTVNGTPNVRACLAVAAPGDEVRTQIGDGFTDVPGPADDDPDGDGPAIGGRAS